MLDELSDPNPREPTSADRAAIERRGRRLVRRRRGVIATGSLAVVALVTTGAFAVVGDGRTTDVATEVAGVTETEPPTTAPPPTTARPEPEPMTDVVPPSPSPAAPPAPSAASIDGQVVAPAGFAVTRCVLDGAPLELRANTFSTGDLAPEQRVEIVCDARSGDGAALAARVVVDLRPGVNPVRVTL